MERREVIRQIAAVHLAKLYKVLEDSAQKEREAKSGEKKALYERNHRRIEHVFSRYDEAVKAV